MKGAMRVAIAMLLVMAPVYWLPGVPVVWVSILKDVVFLILLACFMLYTLVEKGKLRIPGDLAARALFALLFLLLLVLPFASPAAGNLNLFLMGFVAPVLLLVTTYNAIGRRENIASFAKVLLGPLIVMAVYAICIRYNVLRPVATPSQFHAHALYMMSFSYSRGAFGIGMAYAIPFSVGMTLQLYKERRPLWIGGVIVNVLLLMALVGTLARSALVAALLGAGVVVLAFSKKIALVAAVAVTIVIGILYAPQTSAWLRIGTDLDTFTSGRADLYKIAVNMIGRHPLVGVGLGRYSAELGGDSSDEDLEPQLDDPHNLFLWIASENGVLAGLLAFLFVGLLVLKSTRLAVKSHSMLLASFAGAVVAGSSLSLVDSGVVFGAFSVAVPWWISVAVVLKCTSKDVRRDTGKDLS
jgi:O-antigen ligase